MRDNFIRLAAATAIGAAVITVASAAGAADVVIRDDGYGPQRYVYDSGRYYTGPSYAYRTVRPDTRVIVRPEGSEESVYIGPDSSAYDGCTYKRERGLFGGWHEERNCP